MSLTTATQMTEPIDAYGFYDIGTDFGFRVRIVDTRQRYGQMDYLIVPVSGRGQKWVAHHKVRITQS